MEGLEYPEQLLCRNYDFVHKSEVNPPPVSAAKTTSKCSNPNNENANLCSAG